MNSNLTPAEQWRLHGTFNEETVDHLLALHDANEDRDPQSLIGDIDEIAGCIPEEDALTAVLRDLALLVKRARGGTKDTAQEIFNDLHAIMEKQKSDSEHASDLLRQVRKSLNGDVEKQVTPS